MGCGSCATCHVRRGVPTHPKWCGYQTPEAGLHDRLGVFPSLAFLARRKSTDPDQESVMNMNYDLAKAEIATRLHHAEHRRSARRARAQQRPAQAWRWQRSRAT